MYDFDKVFGNVVDFNKPKDRYNDNNDRFIPDGKNFIENEGAMIGRKKTVENLISMLWLLFPRFV